VRADRASVPAPLVVPGEFLVILDRGWGGSLHDLAKGLAEWEMGAEAAIGMLLTWLKFVEIELKGFEDLLEQLHLLRGALVTAGIEAVGTIRPNEMELKSALRSVGRTRINQALYRHHLG